MTLRVRAGSSRAAGGQSHSWVTATMSGPSPSSKQNSVADGTRFAIRIARAL